MMRHGKLSKHHWPQYRPQILGLLSKDTHNTDRQFIEIAPRSPIRPKPTPLKEPYNSLLKDPQVIETAISESTSISTSTSAPISISPLKEPFKENLGFDRKSRRPPKASSSELPPQQPRELRLDLLQALKEAVIHIINKYTYIYKYNMYTMYIHMYIRTCITYTYTYAYIYRTSDKRNHQRHYVRYISEVRDRQPSLACDTSFQGL